MSPGRTPRRLARAAARLLAFAASNLALAAGYFLALPLAGWTAAGRRRLRDAVFGAWARASLACAGVRLEVRGPVPRGPCYLVANHLVYLDIWVLAARTRAVFVAESGIASWPFFGFMARRLSIIFVDRANRRSIPGVNRRIEEAYARGHVVAFFPEGRNGDGTAILPFRSSLLEPAAREGRPVAWARIEYRTRPPDPPAGRSVVWKDGVPLPRHARDLLMLDRIDATVTFGDETLRGRDRKALAAELRLRVAEGFEAMGEVA